MDIDKSKDATSSLRIITWNCNQNFSSKFSQLSELNADIWFIQECEELPQDFFPGKTVLWMGKSVKKGLAVIVPSDYKVEKVEVSNSLIYFLPYRIGEVFLISVWAFNNRARRFGINHSGYLADALQFYDRYITQNSRVIIAGDLNNGPRWDNKKFHRNNFNHIQTELMKRGLSSSYHAFFNEPPGGEKFPTHYHHRDFAKPFHIDYVFTKGFKVSDMTVGNYDKWIIHSDHMPLVINLVSQDS